MNVFSNLVAKHRKLVLLLATLLLLPSLYGMIKTNINYDILAYLPEDLDSVKGQNVLNDTFKSASMGMLVIENMEDKDVIDVKGEIEKVKGVDSVTWIDDLLDISVPEEILPDDIKDIFYSEDSTLLMINFQDKSSSDITQDAIEDIRGIVDDKSFLSGMSAVIKDTIDLADSQTPIYVGLAVVLAILILILTLESTVVPFIILISIGYAIVYNFGSNIFLGEISYITKSLAAVLQLGVTLDYSIFLLHRFQEESKNTDDKETAMAHSISKTASSVIGSSLTTIAGFLSIAFMELTIGKDIGIVMAKGVILGVLSVLTILPSLILVFDKPINRFKHKTLLPEFNKLSDLVTRKYKFFIIVGLILFLPTLYGQLNNDVYYNLDESLPDDLDSIVSLEKLKTNFNMTTTHMAIVSDKVPDYEIYKMIDKIKNVKGIENVLTYQTFIGPGIPENFIPEKAKSKFQKDGYKQLIINSKYRAATDEENIQIKKVDKIIKNYDEKAMLTGEGVLTKDLIDIADRDFKRVNLISYFSVFIIIMLIFISFSIPLLLILVIMLAIFINMSVPFYLNHSIPFIASIVIGSIQLGATVDYAILLTTRFKEELKNNTDKFKSMQIAVRESSKSIITSGLTFFASTIGVAIISNMEFISSLSTMIARGALISTAVILFILPGLLLAAESIINKTTKNWVSNTKRKGSNVNEK
ncbi:MMPL family transporter [Clostridium sp. D2Q-14]|uniref:efflux RND transporter permease subunit n=1 Tax=Anaeromonas gelatinilytica TaxID=2683194 RepID=UPI00193BAB5B|nr:efflux RND transporter permease subunit [Anaeromonas gelatinilytica]MBS4534119.1 MMPL family transporter [Anaeromonas gelatinilytica]